MQVSCQPDALPPLSPLVYIPYKYNQVTTFQIGKEHPTLLLPNPHMPFTFLASSQSCPVWQKDPLQKQELFGVILISSCWNSLTLTLLETDQLFWRLSLNLGHLRFPRDSIQLCIFGRNVTEVTLKFFPPLPIRQHAILICPMTGDVYLGQLIKVVSARIITVKYSVSLCNKYFVAWFFETK